MVLVMVALDLVIDLSLAWKVPIFFVVRIFTDASLVIQSGIFCVTRWESH